MFWVSNYRAGLSKHNPRTRAFTHFTAATGTRPGLAENTSYAVIEDQSGDIWVGSESKGLTWYHRDGDRYSYFVSDPARPGSIRNNYVLAILERSNGDLWIGTGLGVDLYHRKTKNFTHVTPVPSIVLIPNEFSVKALLEDHAGILWYGTLDGGLFRFDPKTGATRRFRNDPRDAGSISSNGVWALCETRAGDLWVGTFGGGLDKYDRESDRFIRFVSPEIEAPGALNNNAIYCIQEDPDGALWLGTYGGGLNRFDLRTGTFRHWTQKNGLPNNFVKGILRDSLGYLWLSTDNGLSRFEPRRDDFANFSREDGLCGDVFLSGCFFRGRSGTLYFGGEEGVTSFLPEEVQRNEHIPPVVITSVSVDDHVRSLGEVFGSPDGLDLQHDQNAVSIEFVALDFAAPARNRYIYRMEGIDKSWIQAAERRDVRYAQMPPGEYVFRVKASNADGVWNEAGVSVRFRIRPPFWETWWFRLLALTIIAAGAVAIYRYRVNRLLDVERLRVRIASDLHDDIGSSLTRIALQSELIREGIEPGAIPTYLQNIADTSRELVTTMSDIVWSIDARNDTCEHLITKIHDFAAGTLAAKQVQVTLTSSGLDPHRKLPVDVRENIYLISKEAVNNIAKHSGATTATISLKNSREGFTMVIHDNGSGWGGTASPTGHGVRNMRMRAERLGGAVAFECSGGTNVVVTLPPL